MVQVIIIKVGGVASENLTPTFFKQLKIWQHLGKKIILVHGGGQAISQKQVLLNLPTETKNGLRVTTSAVLEVAKDVLINEVQPKLTAALSAHGFKALGLNASCEQLLIGQQASEMELGFVGTISQVNTAYLERLLAADYLPVIAPLALTPAGQWLNINADETAAAIASALHAEKLYLLTDVCGVLYHNQQLTHLSTTLVQRMTREGSLGGGMIPKVKSGLAALENGVKTVLITSNLADKGTRLMAGKGI